MPGGPRPPIQGLEPEDAGSAERQTSLSSGGAMTTYEIQHMRGWRRFARTVRAASRAEAERLCLPWEWVDDEVLAVIPAEAEVAERWQRLNEDLVGSLEGLERLRRDE